MPLSPLPARAATQTRRRITLTLLTLAFASTTLGLAACGDDPDVPPKSTSGGESGAGGTSDAGAGGGDAGTTAAGAAGATAGAGGAATAGAGGDTGAGAGGGAATGGSAGASPGTVAASGPTHGSARDVGVGQMSLRLGDFPFACAEHPAKPSCGAAGRALVAIDVATASLVAGATVELAGQAQGVSAQPGCATSSAAFTGALAVTEVTAATIKATLSGSNIAGFDGAYELARCTAAVPSGNAVATRNADGSVSIEGGTYAISCATTPTTPPCGDQQRVRLTLAAAMLTPGKYPLATTPAPAPTFASSSDESSGCKVDEGALTGQVEVVEVLGDRVRVRPIGTNVLSINNVVLEALFCN